jgi:hypothetical protein
MKLTIKPGGATSSFPIDQAPEALRHLPEEFYDLSLPHELHSDKSPFKFVPCTVCKRPMIVNTFYVLAWAKCSTCGGADDSRERGSVTASQAGKTEPALAVDLAAILVNRTEFEIVNCPFGHGEMELKSVSHSDNYGPWHYEPTPKGGRIRVQHAVGETTMHQCNECRCTVSMSTTAQSTFKRINEAKHEKHVNGWTWDLGARDDDGS